MPTTRGVSPQSGSAPEVRLTRRGRQLRSVMVLALVLTLGWGVVRAARGDGLDPAVAATPLAVPTASAQPSAPARAVAPPSAPTARATPKPKAKVPATKAMYHSGLVGTGTYASSTLALPAAKTTSNPHRFIVRVEGGVDVDPNAAARQIHSILNDPRGWTGYHGASFALVADASRADLVINIASPPTVDKRCAPTETIGTWSCGDSNRLMLNSDRWQRMTPTYADLTAYRAYMVNHEVGHFLGRGHVGCPAAGGPAPVMLRQSMSLEGCVINAWPRLGELAGT